jgi:hypothetical protein
MWNLCCPTFLASPLRTQYFNSRNFLIRVGIEWLKGDAVGGVGGRLTGHHCSIAIKGCTTRSESVRPLLQLVARDK